MLRLPGYQSRGARYAAGLGEMGYAANGYARRPDSLLPLALRLRTQAQWLAATGLTLSDLLLCEDAASPLTNEIGATTFAVAGGTLQASTPYSGKVGVAFEGTGEYANAAAWDPDGSTSQAFIAFLVCSAVASTNNGLWAKNAGSTSPGYRALVHSTGNMRFRIRDSVPNTREAEITEDHVGYVGPAAFVEDRAAQLLRVHTTLGSATIDITGVTAVTSTQDFEIGRAFGTANGLTGNRILSFARVVGANAEGVDWGAVITTLSRGL